jgi:hypothetical protein
MKLCAAVAVGVAHLDDVSAGTGGLTKQELMFPMAKADRRA